MAKDIRKRISNILKAITVQVYEREHIVALSLLGALSNENIFLLGRPGVGKSLVARRLKYAFRGARAFEYLMSRFSTPDDVFGPVSISKLKEEDAYERKVDGFLPGAEVVFLDEIWKAGPAIQNALLTVLNEKIYLNGQTELTLPTKLVISASNELPAEGEGLEALWDRFLVRAVVEPIKSASNFKKLLVGESSLAVGFSEGLSDEEYHTIQKEAATVTIPDELIAILISLREKLADDNDGTDLYISDRRWAKVAKIMRTSAYLNGRKKVDISDILIMESLLWNHPDQREYINELVENEVADCYQMMVDQQVTDFKLKHVERMPKLKSQQKLKFYSPDGIHYEVQAGDYKFKIKIDDYMSIHSSIYGVIDDNNVIIPSEVNGEVTLAVHKEGFLSINSVNYPLTPAGRMESSDELADDVTNNIKQLYSSINNLVDDNLFCKPFQEYAILYSSIKKMI